MRLSMSPLNLSRQLDYQHPVFFDQGVWLFATSRRPSDPADLLTISPAPSDKDLPSEIAKLPADIKNDVSTLEPISGDAALWLNNRVPVSLVSDLAAMDTHMRTVMIQSVARIGVLFKFAKDLKVFGTVGIFGSLPTADAAKGTIELTSISSTVGADGGVVVSADVGAHSESPISTQIQHALIEGPPVEYDITITGGAVAKATGPFRTFTSTNENIVGLFAGIDVGCTQIIPKMNSSGGKLLAAIPIVYPDISVEVPFNVFQDKQRAALVIDSIPRRTALMKERQPNEPAAALEIRSPQVALDATVTPESVNTEAAGTYSLLMTQFKGNVYGR
jgi:hypothetical protein